MGDVFWCSLLLSDSCTPSLLARMGNGWWQGAIKGFAFGGCLRSNHAFTDCRPL
jgi:hypothetical protein